jgi:hypothetical protein
MSEKMVRTQVYLPRRVYDQLQRRAERHGLTLALQIREALEGYLLRGDTPEDKMEPVNLNNLFEITGKFGGSGLSDSSVNHDKYIYGDPHGEKALERERLRASSRRSLRSSEGEIRTRLGGGTKQLSVAVARERPASYKTKKRPLTKSKKSRP